VKYTCGTPSNISEKVEDTIQNGIIKTKSMDEWVNTERIVTNVINNSELKEKL